MPELQLQLSLVASPLPDLRDQPRPESSAEADTERRLYPDPTELQARQHIARQRKRKGLDMGMFDKDKEIGNQLTAEFDADEHFIIWDAKLDGTVNTEIGEARKSKLTVSHLDAPTDKLEVTTLASAIADKVTQVEPEKDFPAVACWRQVDSNFGGKATVIQFVRDYDPINA